MTGKWKTFGTTLIGSGHIKINLPNQDAWGSKSYDDYSCIVVADGVGSCKYSDVASKTICQSVLKVTENIYKSNEDVMISELFARIIDCYNNSLSKYNSKDCSTTCLFCFRKNDSLLVSSYGDGLASILFNNDNVISLIDNKEDSFSNVVSAISPHRQNSLRHIEKQLQPHQTALSRMRRLCCSLSHPCEP